MIFDTSPSATPLGETEELIRGAVGHHVELDEYGDPVPEPQVTALVVWA